MNDNSAPHDLGVPFVIKDLIGNNWQNLKAPCRLANIVLYEGYIF